MFLNHINLNVWNYVAGEEQPLQVRPANTLRTDALLGLVGEDHARVALVHVQPVELLAPGVRVKATHVELLAQLRVFLEHPVAVTQGLLLTVLLPNLGGVGHLGVVATRHAQGDRHLISDGLHERSGRRGCLNYYTNS